MTDPTKMFLVETHIASAQRTGTDHSRTKVVATLLEHFGPADVRAFNEQQRRAVWGAPSIPSMHLPTLTRAISDTQLGGP